MEPLWLMEPSRPKAAPVLGEHWRSLLMEHLRP
jgi:hypothetical protein